MIYRVSTFIIIYIYRYRYRCRYRYNIFTHDINHDLSMQSWQNFGFFGSGNDNGDVNLDGWNLRLFKVQIFGAMSLRGRSRCTNIQYLLIWYVFVSCIIYCHIVISHTLHEINRKYQPTYLPQPTRFRGFPRSKIWPTILAPANASCGAYDARYGHPSGCPGCAPVAPGF